MNNNVLILGAGLSAIGASELGRKMRYNVRVSSKGKINSKDKRILLKIGACFEENQHSVSNLNWADVIIKSPGISPDIPFLKNARSKNIPIISEIEFASNHTDSKIIAITGTNGKTTTSTLLYSIMRQAGYNVALVGNIGTSFSSSIVHDSVDYYVLEVSSFQLEDIKNFKPNIAIVLNIEKDHLNRYKDFNQYAKTKMNIQINQDNTDTFIYLATDKSIMSYTGFIKARKYPFSYSNIENQEYGGWVEKNKIIINTIKNQFTMTIHNLALQGTHNIYNSMAASIAASTMGIKNEVIKKSLSDFRGIEHRLEFVAKISGVNFINDSKATNCNAVYYALESISSKIIWICGGVDKGNDYSILDKLVSEKVKSIIVLGKNKQNIYTHFKNIIHQVDEVDNMEQAVKKSFSKCDAGDTVLLSPACSSFDLFQNYEDRGRMFKKSVLSI